MYNDFLQITEGPNFNPISGDMKLMAESKKCTVCMISLYKLYSELHLFFTKFYTTNLITIYTFVYK
jgi:hypothetical protein